MEKDINKVEIKGTEYPIIYRIDGSDALNTMAVQNRIKKVDSEELTLNWDRDKYDLLLYLYTYRAIHHNRGYLYACDKVINILRERYGEYVTSETIEFAMRKFDSIPIVNNAANRYPNHKPIYTKRMFDYHRDVFLNGIYGSRRWNTIEDLNYIMNRIGIQP